LTLRNVAMCWAMAWPFTSSTTCEESASVPVYRQEENDIASILLDRVDHLQIVSNNANRSFEVRTCSRQVQAKKTDEF
jgi:hypothetical protein